ncbi:bone morphogenetic protein 1-like isoform X2 [Dendronephthya gigantea]|uniref:bone morphogenetic protein 1-like isoform X2 n=1 Tax=Dendronephthya gigantea TaxID=151771 RepID=UPI00106AE75D|nr:bone morphogenetic protein 1-like isoform X2 [Dendronephthya gigantea]
MTVEQSVGYLIFCSCFVVNVFAGTCNTTTHYRNGNGTIYGPGWPFQYPNNVSKCWRIEAPFTNHVVKLNIDTLDMEACSLCGCDYIEVFNGYDEYSLSFGRLCSRSWQFTSTGRYFYLTFTSDGSRNGKAFTASYVAEPKDNTNNSNSININGDGGKTKTGSGSKTTGYAGGGVGTFVFIIILACLYQRYCKKDD